MARDNQIDIRAEVVALLMDKVVNDRYPSVTLLDMIESMMSPEERDGYARMLMDKVDSSRYPSIPMLRRLLALG